MSYITDAAREYLLDPEQRFNDLSESFINMVEAFDKEHHDELVELLKKYPADLNAGPGIGSNVLLEYFELLKKE